MSQDAAPLAAPGTTGEAVITAVPSAMQAAPSAASKGAAAKSATAAAKPARDPGLYATIRTSMGDIKVVLFEKQSPLAVKNFVGLSQGTKTWTDPRTGQPTRKPLYNGVIFHRVIPNFMIQGGDPLGAGYGGPGYKFADETKGSPHKFDKAGKLAMANAGPNTNGSQFFVTVAPTPWLTGNHTIFGEVVEGQDVADKIANVPRGPQDKPKKEVVLESVTIERS